MRHGAKTHIGLLFCLMVLISISAAGQNETAVVKNSWLEYTDASNALYHHLSGQAYNLLKQRSDKISGINTFAGWERRQQEIRNILTGLTGPFPPKTELNPKIIRIIDKKSYTLEHILFESQPRFYVTSSLFIPVGFKRNAKLPAVIYCSGHSEDGYRSAVYQHVILNLVSKGFIVFAFDPVGQGERLEYFDNVTGKSKIGGPTMEHSYPGAQAFLTGSSQAMYMILDGIRAVDYLLTRKEVDPARIGITGRSGGGTQSAYIAAFDDRIYAAAPENYLTNYTRLLQSIGPQDAEQNLSDLIYQGIDHPDFLIVRAPKPTLMITTTRDMFSIQGAIETEEEVRHIYKAYGRDENFSRAEDDAGHESTLKNREAMYAFFQKHLNNPGNPQDEKVELLTPDELRVTVTGQVSTSMDCETVFSLNKKVAERLEKKLDSLRKEPVTFLPEALRTAKLLSGFDEPSYDAEPVFTGRFQKDNYILEKYFIKGEGDYVIPYLLFRPFKPGNNAIIYLHPAGKSAEAGAGGEIEQYVREGYTVLAPDLTGTGESGQGALSGDAYFGGVSHNLWYTSMLIKRSITGLHAEEVLKLADVLRKDNQDVVISGCAREELIPAMLHAAAFSGKISNVILSGPFTSYMSIVTSRFYDPTQVTGAVPGALVNYDLPDLAGALAPRRLIITGVTESNNLSAENQGINRDLDIIRNAYSSAKACSQLKITADAAIGTILKLLRE